MVATTLTPKRVAGILTAAPAVALGSLLMTVAFNGRHDAAVATLGMAAGAVGLVAYGAVVVPAFPRLGAMRGATVAVLAWAVAAFCLYAAVIR